VEALNRQRERLAEMQMWWKKERQLRGETMQQYRLIVNGWEYDVKIIGD
jgi:hypothetical protein